MALTAKNKLLAEEYVANGYNAVQAYIKAFNYPVETEKQYRQACANVSKLINKPEVKEYIDYIQHERFEALHITADRIGEELSAIAFGITGENCSEGGKLKALELLGKQLQLYTQKIEAKVDETVITVSIDEDED